MSKHILFSLKLKVLVTQSCLTLCDPLDCRNGIPGGSSVHGILCVFSKQEYWCGLPFWIWILQRIFLAQRSNLGLPRCRWILYHLSHLYSLVPSTKNLLNVNGVTVVLSTTNIIKNKNRQCTHLTKQ